MNAGLFEAWLDRLAVPSLRALCREFVVCHRGPKPALVARLMDLHADPVCMRGLVHRALDFPTAKKRRRVDDPVVRQLWPAFEAVGGAPVAACPARNADI
jgi:hypothetical protein